MKKQKKLIVRIAFAITILAVCGFFISGQELRKLNDKVDEEIKAEQVKVASQQEKLDELKKELEKMDTLEYIRKIATEQLRMVESDTIVFREKQ